MGSRGWLWTAGLLLAALSTCLAEDPPVAPTTPVTSKITIADTNTTQAPVTEKTNATANPTEPAPPKPSPSSTPAKSATTAAPPPSSTTKAPAPSSSTATTSSSTTVTSKATVTSTTGSPTTTNPTTNTMSSGSQKISGFDVGSFVGGIVLTLAILAIAYFGCRFYNSRRGVRYRTIDEHEAII